MSTFFCNIWRANCFVFAGSSWSFRKTILSFRPLTPPLALIALIWICAARSAGASNGAMFLVRSTTAPITIGGFAAPESVRAAAAAARIPAAAATSTSATRVRVVRFISTPLRCGSCRDPPFFPTPCEALTATTYELAWFDVPERIWIGRSERAVVREDLEVVAAVPAGTVERAEDRRDVGAAVARQHPVGPAASGLAPVAHVHAGEPGRVALDLVEQVRGVPEVPDVELDAERRGADLFDQLDGVVQRVDDRPVLDPLALKGLERDPHAGPLRVRADLAQAFDHGRPVRARPGEAEDGGRPKGSKPVDRAHDRIDAFARVLGAGQERQRQDRRNGRNPGGGAAPARLERCERAVVGAVAELQLPDADCVHAALGVRANVVSETRGERAHLRDGELRDTVRFRRHAVGQILARV